MNRLFFFPLLFCLPLFLTACGETLQSTAPAEALPAARQEDAPAVPPAEMRAAAQEAVSGETAQDAARRAAFAEVLRTAHDRQILPDGTALDGNSIEDIEGNLFTVHDVDGDGGRELVLLWQNAVTAGQTEIVYGYDSDTGRVREKLRDFPGILFYDNGAAEAPWSHNQGWAGEFWPYNLHRYRPETDVYEDMGSVDAWDKELVSSGFPRDVDADGDGMVYVLLTDNWQFTCHEDPAGGPAYWYYEQPPVDGAEYLTWRDGIVGDAKALELTFMPLTAENIAGILEVPYVELITTLPPNAAG